MKIANFDEYRYYPTLRTRSAEIKGLEKLDTAMKQKMLPLITLGKWPKSDDFAKSADKAVEAMEGNPFFFDLPNDPRHHSISSSELTKPADNFERWREFISRYEHAIPIVQMTGGTRREISQQARKFEASVGKVGFRIRDFSKETPLVIAALSALDSVENALVFLDAQYIRSAFSAYVAACTGTINALRAEVPETLIATLSTSFPASRTQFCDGNRTHGAINNLDRELHESIGGTSIAMYGDYGAIHAVIYDDQPIMMRWSPTIDYPLDYEWVFERRPGTENGVGYIDAAKALVETFPEIATSTLWGDNMIADAANGNLFGSGPQSWIAVRVNLHLARQLQLSEFQQNIEELEL
jgi:hypothetical protein